MMIVCSRTMSWAVGSTWLTGGRRNAKVPPWASVTRKVRLDRPPAISSNSSGAVAPTCSTIQWVTPASLIPVTIPIVAEANSEMRPLLLTMPTVRLTS